MALKALNTLIRYRQRQLDALRRQLAALQEKKRALEEKAERLSRELEAELKLAEKQPEMGGFFGNFADRIRSSRAELLAQAVNMEQQLERLAERVREEFAAVKRFEIVRERRMEAEAAEERRKENIRMDEIGQQLFMRAERGEKQEAD